MVGDALLSAGPGEGHVLLLRVVEGEQVLPVAAGATGEGRRRWLRGPTVAQAEAAGEVSLELPPYEEAAAASTEHEEDNDEESRPDVAHRWGVDGDLEEVDTGAGLRDAFGAVDAVVRGVGGVTEKEQHDEAGGVAIEAKEVDGLTDLTVRAQFRALDWFSILALLRKRAVRYLIPI